MNSGLIKFRDPYVSCSSSESQYKHLYRHLAFYACLIYVLFRNDALVPLVPKLDLHAGIFGITRSNLLLMLNLHIFELHAAIQAQNPT